MSEENPVGCARPTGGPVAAESPTEAVAQAAPPANKEQAMIQVGKPAPDFEAPAYHQGKFTSVKLSEHLGKWVLLCFYPGDFTFV